MGKEMRQRGKRGVWYAMAYYKGVKIFDCLDTTDEKIAMQRLAELKFEIERGEYRKYKIPFRECARRYTDDELSLKSKASQVRYESALRVHLMPFFGDYLVGQIVTYDEVTGVSMVTEFFKKLGHLPESSLKKVARVLRDVLRMADKDFELPAIVYRNKGFYQKQFLRQEELNLILGLLDEQHQAIAMLMAYTGLSLGDAVNLRWGNIDLNTAMIRTVRSKSGQTVVMGICAPLMDLLKYKSRVRNLHDDRVFRVKTSSFQKAWKRVVLKIDLSWVPRPTDLRHFFASTLLNRGEDHLVVATLMGHTSVQMLHKRYGHYDDDRLKKAVSVFDVVSAKTTPIKKNG